MPLLDARGLAVSTDDPDAVAAFERALDSLHGHHGDAMRQIEGVLVRNPHLAIAHCLRAAAHILADEKPSAELADALDAIERQIFGANERERRHAAAALAFFAGETRRSLEIYGNVLVDYPRDSLALQVTHAIDFRLGQREMLRERAARALPDWHATTPGFGYVLGMYAFGLEETGDYAQAETTARRSLEIIPDNAAAIHVIAHVMEMQGRAREGIAWLEAARPIWESNPGFCKHIAWHLALFHLDRNTTDKALLVYDQTLAPHATSSTNGLVDASALLWRLTLRGAAVGSRWRELANAWKRKRLAGGRAFNLVHAIMAFAAAGRITLARRTQRLLRDAAARLANSEDDVSLATSLSDGLRAFARGDYAGAVESLTVVRAIAHRCGGSIAQCDLIHLTLTEAALRSRHARLARALTAERTERKPQSLFNRWLSARAAISPAPA